jgi:hypothetical protein
MPKCKNNPSRSYKGTEPSPKGKGFCASGAKVGQRKRGTDGNMWIVKRVGKSQRWVKCVGKKSMKKKTKSTNSTNSKQTSPKKTQPSENICFTIKFTPNNPAIPLDQKKLETFLKSKWARDFLEDCQWAGVSIKNVRGKRYCYDKTVKLTQVSSVHGKKGNISMKVCGKLIEYKDSPNIPAKQRDILEPIGTRADFLKQLKATWNHSIYAGGFITMRYSTFTNDIGIASIV